MAEISDLALELSKNNRFRQWLIDEDEVLFDPVQIESILGKDELEHLYKGFQVSERRRLLGVEKTTSVTATPLHDHVSLPESFSYKQKAALFKEPPEHCPQIPKFESREAEQRYARTKYPYLSREAAIDKWDDLKAHLQSEWLLCRAEIIAEHQRWCQRMEEYEKHD